MKKYLVVALIAGVMSTTAGAFSLPKDGLKNKLILNKCLLEEGTKMLKAGQLTKDTIEQSAPEVATVCTTKLALGDADETTVRVATEVLRRIVK